MADTDELHYMTLRDLAEQFRRRTLSPVEVVKQLLDRIAELDHTLHCFVTLTHERALAEAKAAEARLRRGHEASPLLGIPVAYKDLYATRGVRTTAGSALLADWVPDADATCVVRLRDAGMVMLGKLITHEFAFGIQVPGHYFPPARNPWHREYIPGGSSSGSAAALSAGFTVAALGTDSGGSIRTPASFCGVVGLKPTYGRVSRAGIIPLSWTLDHSGPMARTAEDCAYLLQALAGYDPADPASSRVPVPNYVGEMRGAIRGLRVGLPKTYFFDEIDAEVEAAFEQVLRVLRDLGATIQDVTIPSIHLAPAVMIIMMAEAFAYHQRDLREHPERYGDLVRERLLAGGLISGAEYLQAQRLRAQLKADLLQILRTVDVLVTPTNRHPAIPFAVAFNPSTPFPHGNTAPFNMTGLPALAVPCGLSRSGLPLSLQIIGRPFDEASVLKVGHAYQEVTNWHRRRPAI